MLQENLVHLFGLSVGVSSGGAILMSGIVRPALRKVSYTGVSLDMWGMLVARFVPIAVVATACTLLVRVWMIEALPRHDDRALTLAGYLMLDLTVPAILLAALFGSNRRMRRALFLRHDRDARRLAATSSSIFACVGLLGLLQILTVVG